MTDTRQYTGENRLKIRERGDLNLRNGRFMLRNGGRFYELWRLKRTQESE